VPNPHNTTANLGLFVAGPISTEDAIDAGHAATWDFDFNFLLLDTTILLMQTQLAGLPITSINGGTF